MHLSKEIQKRLDKSNSRIRLASTIDGILPDRYAFYNNLGRSFRAEFASSEREYSIVLFESNSEQSYENCFGRGVFVEIDRLVKVIELWTSDQSQILEIKSNFDEIEIFESLLFNSTEPSIERAWLKVRNMFFNDTCYWQNQEWKERYDNMLTEAKEHLAFRSYHPFTSHYSLRFSIDNGLRETWPLNFSIIPTIYSKKVPESSGKYYVSYNEVTMGGQFFETLKDALDFYAQKLKETKPTKWR